MNKLNLQDLWDEHINESTNRTSPANKKQIIKIYNLDHAKTEIERLQIEGANFETYETTNSCKINIFKDNGSKITYWYIEDTKTESFLILLNCLKKEIRQRADAVNSSSYSKDPKETKYFFFSKAFNEVRADAGSIYKFTNVFEADVSHAYYRAAYILGFISKDLYLKIVRTCSKHDRLRLLGSIATKKLWQDYKEGELTNGETIKDDLLRDAWFKICNYVDSALLELKDKLGDDFLFYWVDGIYFKYDAPKIKKDGKSELIHRAKFMREIQSVKFKYDLDFKIIPIVEFELINMNHSLEISILKPDGSRKRFFPNKESIKSYSIKGLNSLNKI